MAIDPPSTVTPEDLAKIPAEHRRTIARFLIQRADGTRGSWVLSDHTRRIVADVLNGAAVDIADPLADDSTIAHAADILTDLRESS